MTTTATHATDTQQRHPDQADVWVPAAGEFMPWSQVYGMHTHLGWPDDDHDGPSEIDQLITDATSTTVPVPFDVAARLALEVGLTDLVDQAVRREAAFRARPLAVRRQLVTVHRRAARRARRARRAHRRTTAARSSR